MPELPEVEVTMMGIHPYCAGEILQKVDCFQTQLRWIVPPEILQLNGKIQSLSRRSKYLIFEFESGWMLMHLGMSGRLSIQTGNYTVKKHDHLVFHMQSGAKMVYHDPRRFGAVLWFPKSKNTTIDHHPLFSKLGVEPLGDSFTAEFLFAQLQKKSQSIKTLLLSNQVVVGVGNIYASETLYLARIHPATPANQLSRDDCIHLTAAIQEVLQTSIAMGGSTLKDFLNADGKKGYFQTVNQVYGREGEPCQRCSMPIDALTLGQRNTFFCPNCQKLVVEDGSSV